MPKRKMSTAGGGLVRYVPGKHRRIVDGYEWNQGNGWVKEVAAEDLPNLSQYPEFELVNLEESPVEPVEEQTL